MKAMTGTSSSPALQFQTVLSPVSPVGGAAGGPERLTLLPSGSVGKTPAAGGETSLSS